jgi:hypothetical protein
MNKIQSILASILITFAGLSMLTGCDTVETALQNDTVKEVSLDVAKTLIDFGLTAVIANNPDYATELDLAKTALTLDYDTVFADGEADSTLTLAQVAENLRTQLAENISDPEMVAALQAQLAEALASIDSYETPAASIGGENLAPSGRALARELLATPIVRTDYSFDPVYAVYVGSEKVI